MGKYDNHDYCHLDRKAKKPLMEKKRRKRINQSLDELKNLMLEIMNKDPTQTAKLEKADILEITVEYLKRNQLRQMEMSSVGSTAPAHHFGMGWMECWEQVSKYFAMVNTINPTMKAEFMRHWEGVRSRFIQGRQAFGVFSHGPYLPMVRMAPAPPYLALQPPQMAHVALSVAMNIENSLDQKSGDIKNAPVEDQKQVDLADSMEDDKGSQPWRPW